MQINLAEETVQVKVINHPGFDYSNTYDHPENAKRKVCNFGNDKVAIVGQKGAFFGKEPQYVEFNSTHKFSCLTIFRSRDDAKLFVEFINWKIKAQLEMAWLDVT